MAFPQQRLRRLRANPTLRRMVRQTRLSVDQLIYPLFVRPGSDVRQPIRSMPGQYQLSVDTLVAECKQVAELGIPALGEQPFPGVFIRAPIVECSNSTVEMLAQLPDGTAVAVRQGRLLATAFHPELTEDLRFHRYFLDIAAERASSPPQRNADAKGNH